MLVAPPPQDAAGLAFFGSGVGEADMGIERNVLTTWIVGIVGQIVFVLKAERRTARLVAANNGLLFAERGAIPALAQIADNAHHLVGAARRPGWLVGLRLHPHDAIHQGRIACV